MNILYSILYFVVLLGITFGVAFFGRKYVFSRVRVNKFVPLALAIIFFLIQIILPRYMPVNVLMSSGLTIIVVIFFIWFMDILSTGGPKAKEKKIDIRPKAKPNRAKHINKNDNK